jgi:hypothetical protein
MSAVREFSELAQLREVAAPKPFDAEEAKKRARAILSPAMVGREVRAYPSHALGPLSAACEAIATEGQVQPAMAGQCVLAAASLLTQGLYNVETLNGVRPLSINGIIFADSGDGKSTATDAALRPVNEWQRKAAKQYAGEMAEYERAKATRKPNEEPEAAPMSPFRIVADATVEGLRRDLATGPCSQGVFTDEAASILCGYGMSADHRVKTAAVFSKLWDSGHLSFSRAGGPRLERYGRRLANNWLIQPQAGAEAASDAMLSAQGFWPRFLAAWPAPQAPRLARPFRPDTVQAIGAYWARCSELLRIELPDDAGDAPAIPLSGEARSMLGKAFEAFEVAARKGSMRAIKPFALRASEQACRVAGVLSAFDHRDTIGPETMRGALEVVSYSLDTWAALIDGGPATQGATDALRLYDWLILRPNQMEALSTIPHDGPSCVRSRDKRDAALDRLSSAGLAEVAGKYAYALCPEAE